MRIIDSELCLDDYVKTRKIKLLEQYTSICKIRTEVKN